MKMTSFKNNRTCIGCRKKDKHENLIKITKIKDKWFVQNDTSLHGRSFYIHSECYKPKNFSKKIARYRMDTQNIEEIIESMERHNG